MNKTQTAVKTSDSLKINCVERKRDGKTPKTENLKRQSEHLDKSAAEYV